MFQIEGLQVQRPGGWRIVFVFKELQGEEGSQCSVNKRDAGDEAREEETGHVSLGGYIE
jgi:hypothetical protein